MAKTTFSSGVIVTSQWLNGAKQIYFDGQDLDWHYPPLGLDSVQFSGANGLDARYVTLAGEQSGCFNTPPISGSKTVTGPWNFGYEQTEGASCFDIGVPQNSVLNAPLSFTTNSKFNYAGGASNPSFDQKFSSLNNADLITKEILLARFQNLYIDNGFYARADSTCNNYAGTPASNQCPVG
jgi:hypothetical protein